MRRFEKWVNDKKDSDTLFWDGYGKYRDWFNNIHVDYSRIAIDDEKIDEGVCYYTKAFCPEAPGIYKVCNGCRKRMALRGIDSPAPLLFTIQIFLDQFRDAKKPLPVVDPRNLYRYAKGLYAPDYMPKPPTYSVFKQLMEIMIRPLNTYDDLISSLKLYETLTGKNVLNSTAYFDGIGRVKKFTGNIIDWTNNDLDEIVLENPNEYAIYSRIYWERSSEHYQREEKPKMWFYDVRHLYEYILNYYCDIV